MSAPGRVLEGPEDDKYSALGGYPVHVGQGEPGQLGEAEPAVRQDPERGGVLQGVEVVPRGA